MDVLLVGLGEITKKYKTGIINNFNLRGVVDINEEASGIKYYRNFPYYKDLKQAIKETKASAIIIATPPKTHYQIIKEALNNNVNVYVEKLVGFTREELVELINLSKEKELFVKVMYHWQYGNELLNLNKDNLSINNIEVKIKEVYTKYNNEVLELKRSLGNVLVDGLPNALSVLNKFIDVSKLTFETVTKVYNKEKVLLEIVLKFNYQNVSGKIILDWKALKEEKETIITLNEGLIIIDHLNQSTTIGGVTKEHQTTDRLMSHYNNLFENANNKQLINLEDDKLQFKIIEIMEGYNE